MRGENPSGTQKEGYMKRYIIGLSMILLCLASICIAETSQGVKGPKLLIVERTAKLGDVDEGAILEHTFKVQNPGDQPLLIEQVKPG
jgi:hypothetical protein